MTETFLEKAENIGSFHGWTNSFQNEQMARYTNGIGVIINIYPNGTVYPEKKGIRTKSYKKCSDALLEAVFMNPLYRHDPSKLIDPSPKKEAKTPRMTYGDMVEKINHMENKLATLEKLLIDHNIIPKH